MIPNATVRPDELAPTAAPCTCKDAEAELLRDLVTLGLDQREVSHLLWGEPTRASAATTVAFESRLSGRWLRRRRRALGLGGAA